MIEGEAPVRQVCEIREGVPRLFTHAMGAIPAKDGEEGRERIERE